MNKKSITFLIIIFIIVFYPLAIPWYIFALDQTFPYIYTNWPEFGANNYWLNTIGLWFTHLWISTWILEKLTYIMMFSVIGYFSYRLVSRCRYDISKIFTILFLFMNPFFYGRFIEWQINVYLSYAFFIMFFYFVIEYFKYKQYQYWVHISLTSLLLCLTSIHNIFIIALILLVFWLIYSIPNYRDKKFWKYAWLLGVWIIIFNSLWILPTIQREDLTNQIQSFWDNHRIAFESPGGIYDNVYLSVLSGKWYWWEWQWRFTPSEIHNEYYFFIFLVLLLLILKWLSLGLKSKESRALSISLLILGILSYVLALWISGNNIFTGFNIYLFDTVPFYSGFREPHKWVLVIIMIYAYFWAHAVDNIYLVIRSKKSLQSFKNSFILFCVFLPIIYTPAMLFGSWGQIDPKFYPKGWQDLKNNIQIPEAIECNPEITSKCYHTLILPWHGYINVWWTNKPIVISWIFRYFWTDVLYGDTIEIANVYTQSQRKESKIIEKYVPHLDSASSVLDDSTIDNFLNDMQSLWIRNILVVNESDVASYENIIDSLVESQNISIIIENTYGTLYRIK